MKKPRLETLQQKRARMYDLAGIYTELVVQGEAVDDCLRSDEPCGRCEFCQAARIGSTRNSVLVSMEGDGRE